jgi:group I intron endonuclease
MENNWETYEFSKIPFDKIKKIGQRSILYNGDKQQYYFVYETTNLLNGKKYIGYHSTFNLNDNYLGSGKILKNAINKYGKENFKTKIIKFFKNSAEALSFEKDMITEEIINSENYYNITCGGLGGSVKGEKSHSYGKKRSLAHRKKISDFAKTRTSRENPFYGKKHSEETKKYFSDRQKGLLSPVYDHNIYHFINLNGDEFVGTQNEFHKKFNLDCANISKLVNKKIKSFHKWRLIDQPIPKKGPSILKKYKFIHINNMFFEGTQIEFKKKYPDLINSSISRLVNGIIKIHKGWKFYGII